MKSVIGKSIFVLVAGTLVLSFSPGAAEGAKKAKKVSAVQTAPKKKTGQGAGRGKALKAQSGRKLSREFVFDGTDVNGRYHLSTGAVAKVEQEKKMISLIGLPGDFKDRLAEENERLKRTAVGMGR